MGRSEKVTEKLYLSEIIDNVSKSNQDQNLSSQKCTQVKTVKVATLYCIQILESKN